MGISADTSNRDMDAIVNGGEGFLKRMAEYQAAAADAKAQDVLDEDDLYDRAVALVRADQKASTSYLQRRLSIGYNRAADLIERMEHDGLVGPANANGKRELLSAKPPMTASETTDPAPF